MYKRQIEDLATGSFQEVLDDNVSNKANIDTIVLCSGKFYYEMKEQAEERGVENAAYIRIEQMYPLPEKQLDQVLAEYKNVKQMIWAQEEPENMGAWIYMAMNLNKYNLINISRRASAAPAAGSSALHKRRLADLFDRLFAQVANVDAAVVAK